MADVEYREDNALWPLMVSLHQCLCDEMAKAKVPETDCFCGLLPGSDVSFDYTKGQAWVRLSQAYPSTTIVQATQTIGNCALPVAGIIELGILRCAPMPDKRGNPPTVEAQFEATRLQMADMAIMRRAVQCCFAQSVTSEALLSTYTPTGPQGGVVGGTWTVFAGLA